MMSPAMLAQYRKMSPRERIAEMRALLAVASRALRLLDPAERAHRLAAEDALRRNSIDALLLGLAALSEDRELRHGG